MNNKKWEYKIFETYREDHTIKILEKKFNKLGSLGWELVGYVMNDGGNCRLVGFKRELS